MLNQELGRISRERINLLEYQINLSYIYRDFNFFYLYHKTIGVSYKPPICEDKLSVLCKKTSGLKCKKFAVLSSQDITECCLQT